LLPESKTLVLQQLYGFKSKKEYAELDYKLIPDHTINTALIEKYWDDILRVMTSLKLGKTTAEQVLKRLNRNGEPFLLSAKSVTKSDERIW
jgi:TnpA family transposase